MMATASDLREECADYGQSALQETGLSNLFEKHQEYVQSILLRSGLTNAADREDVMQQVFLQAFCNISTLRNSAAFPAWLRAIAINLARNFHRKARGIGKMISLDEDVHSAISREHSPPEIVIEMETDSTLHRAMRILPLMDQRVLHLFHMEQKSLKETRWELSMEEGRSIPEGTVKRRLHVARKRLKEVMEQRGITAHSLE